jgi:hypothetical protein
MQEMVVTDKSATGRTERPRGRKIRQSGIPNRTIQFPRKQQQHLISNRTRRHPMGLLLISREAFRRRQGRGANLRPIAKQSTTQREVQGRWQQSRARFLEQRQMPRQNPGPAHNDHQIG